ncbi:helix-hairpin-helix domain-containing protein [Alcanivorax sp.]|uniref:ComEA family DNA-binding protein n=1 Tax=Alcanivorax sp. TaxID=1872427 RepID=UPI0025B89077|nr:helix-hairpin-helix domain-containing protein [Alcanivorax sp.]
MKPCYVAILPLLMALVMPAAAVELQPAFGTDAVKTAAAEPAKAAGAKAENRAVNLNTADMAELETLHGVGPKTAQAIIDFRDSQGGFTSPDQLLAIKGIGEKTLAKMRDQIVVQ